MQKQKEEAVHGVEILRSVLRKNSHTTVDSQKGRERLLVRRLSGVVAEVLPGIFISSLS